MRHPSRLVVTAVALIVLGLGTMGGLYVYRHQLAQAPRPAPKAAVVIEAPASVPSGTPGLAPSPTPLPPSVFVKVPYTAQSPYNRWGSGDPHEEYCEAAAVFMVGQYFRGDARDRVPPAEADASMAQLVAYERKTFRGVLDLPLTAMGTVGAQFYNLDASVVPVDLDLIEHSLAAGRPVIIPVMTHGANGQRIAPNYGTVNVYHVIVLTGYDTAKGVLYANDAGFMQGQNYAYSWSTLSAAIDAQAQRYSQGRVMLVFSPKR
jgi:Peptidase_C39 like family